MRNTFLISTAAVALVAGMGLASAQAPMEQRQAPAASGQMAPEASKPAGAEQKGQAAQKGDQKSGTSAQAPDKAPTPDKAAAGAKTESSGQAQSQDKAKGQAQSQDKAKGQAQSQDDKGKKTDTSAQDKAKSGGASANVNLSTEQKTKIRETVIRGSNAPRVTNVNFSISVGTVIPRTVRFAPLPTVIVEYYPAWRGYDYFIVGDQIIVVEPRTLRIVAVLDV